MSKAKDAAFYVEDAMGLKYCFTVADVGYEKDFRKHAKWWMRTGYKTIPVTDPRAPVKPFKIVVEPKD